MAERRGARLDALLAGCARQAADAARLLEAQTAAAAAARPAQDAAGALLERLLPAQGHRLSGLVLDLSLDLDTHRSAAAGFALHVAGASLAAFDRLQYGRNAAAARLVVEVDVSPRVPTPPAQE